MNRLKFLLFLTNFINVGNNNITQNNIGVKRIDDIVFTTQDNNIFSNKKYGLVYDAIPKASNNWWGSRFGPSSIIKIFGDKVVQINDQGEIMLISVLTKYISCFPWKRNVS